MDAGLKIILISRLMMAVEDTLRDDEKLEAQGRSEDWIAGARATFMVITKGMLPVMIANSKEEFVENVAMLLQEAQEGKAAAELEKEVAASNLSEAKDVLRTFQQR
jgi:predicted HAD superfamily phosphohydrolase